MLNNAKINPTLKEIMEEVESGESVYTPQEEAEISTILYDGISKGENFDRIYEKKLKNQYPLPKGPGLVNSHIRLRQLYQDMAKLYKKNTSVDKEILFEQVYTRLEEVYWQEADKHDVDGQRKTLMQLKDLIKHALSEKALNKAEESDGQVQYHLDFSL